MRPSELSPLLGALLLTTACPADPAQEVDADVVVDALTPFGCELGIADPDGAFIPLEDADEVELMLGFQGFLLVELMGRTGDPSVELAHARANVAVEGLPAFDSFIGEIRFAPSDGLRTSPPFPLLLESAEVGLYRDREATLVLRFTAADKVCSLVHRVVFVDHDNCFHTGAGAECPPEDQDR